MFEKFSNEARRVVVIAQESARQLRHQSIGTEHLLIGLAGSGEDTAARVLRAHGVTVEQVRNLVRQLTSDGLDPEALATLGIDLGQVKKAAEQRFGPGALNAAPPSREPKGHIPFNARAKTVLGLAVRSAQGMHSGSISTGHLLIGVIDEGHGLAVRVLRKMDIDLIALRAEVMVDLESQAA